jgi:hypothetical protein
MKKCTLNSYFCFLIFNNYINNVLFLFRGPVQDATLQDPTTFLESPPIRMTRTFNNYSDIEYIFNLHKLHTRR